MNPAPTVTSTPSRSTPKDHVWSERLNCWVVPIRRRNQRRPSPNHLLCSDPPCWVLNEPLRSDHPDR